MLQFAKQEALTNPIQVFMYLIAYPVVCLFVKLKFSPNFVTLLSFIFCILSCFSLLNYNQYYFLLFWTFSYILDYVEGTLSRVQNIKRNSALRIDHTSDLVKIVLILLSIAIYYQDSNLWILSFSSVSLFLFYSNLNSYLKTINLINGSSFKKYNKSLSDYQKFSKNKFKEFGFYMNTLTSINGHTLFIFYFLPISLKIANIVLYIFILLLILKISKVLLILNKTKRAF